MVASLARAAENGKQVAVLVPTTIAGTEPTIRSTAAGPPEGAMAATQLGYVLAAAACALVATALAIKDS